MHADSRYNSRESATEKRHRNRATAPMTLGKKEDIFGREKENNYNTANYTDMIIIV